MHDLAFEQVGDRGDTDMRMRSHLDAFAGWKFSGPHVIEKDIRPDHAPFARRQRTAHGKIADVPLA